MPRPALLPFLVYEFCRWTALILVMVLYRPLVRHKRRVPRTGAVLIAANHQSYLDPPLVGMFLRRHCSFVARSGLFKFAPFGRLIAALNSVPLKEDGSDAAAIKEILRRLAEGHAVVIFPEGSRSSDGAQHEFKRGVALLMKRANCPVVPAAVEGCWNAWPPGRAFPRVLRQRVGVSYGRAIPPQELLAHGPDAALARIATEVDALRLDLRARLRHQSRGRFPFRGPGDQSSFQPPPAPNTPAFRAPVA